MNSIFFRDYNCFFNENTFIFKFYIFFLYLGKWIWYKQGNMFDLLWLSLFYRSAIVYVTSNTDFNVADQRCLQYDIHELQPSIPVMRVTFDDLLNHMTLDESDRRLYM